MIDDAIRTLEDGGTLSEQLTFDAFSEIMRGGADDRRITRLLALLAQRPVSVDELTGAARVMREHVTPVPVSESARDSLIDTCGTGGAPKTFNVSTAAALIVAGAGRSGDTPVRVAKHGNRSRTGRGSAEVLMALGVNADASPEVQARCLEEAGVCFCFAIHHHPAVKHATPARRALGHPTIFNLLGPLTNPASASRQLLGCFDETALGAMASTLVRLGSKGVMVCRGHDGLDEVSISAPTRIVYAGLDGDIVEMDRDVTTDFGAIEIGRAPIEDLRVETVEEGAQAILAILGGETGPKADMAMANAAMALCLVRDDGLDGFASAYRAALGAVRSGTARDALEDLKRISHA